MSSFGRSRLERKSERTSAFERLFWIALAVAITPNTIDAFASTSPAWLRPTRIAASTLFLSAVVAVLTSRVVDWQRGNRTHRRRDEPL